MASIEDLFGVFSSFCSFGSSRNLATGSSASDVPQMDNTKFAKFAKDTKIVDNKLVTVTDVDILFNKSKAKAARKLDWESFQTAFQMLAEKRFPGKSPKEAYLLLLDHIVDKAPVARGTVADTNGIYSKLTNTTLYTGTHKNRFDDAGVGKGAAGRVQPTGTVTLGTVVNRGSVTGAGATGTGSAKKRGQTNVVTASSERLDLVSSKPKKVDTHASNSSLSTAAKKSTVVVVEAKPKAPVASRPIARPASASKTGRTSVGATGGSGVFDRLTNVSSYTGTHKSRFNADGTGRGIVGRDAPSLGSSPGKYRGGDVKDLSQILRS